MSSTIAALPDIESADELLDEAVDAELDESEDDEASPVPGEPQKRKFLRFSLSAAVVFGLLPAIAVLLALTAGYLKFVVGIDHDAADARTQSVQAASESTVALLSYNADTVDSQLAAASDRLTGDFRDAYTSLTNDVVIPGSKEKNISSVVTVPAASSVSVDGTHAVALVFVNQTITIGTGAPSSSTSCVRVTMEKIDGRWLISQFEPV